MVPIDRHRRVPLHRQVYEGLRDAILEGRLRPGQRLPSSRGLAAELGVSRLPVVEAFAQLLAEGYCESRPGAGTFVAFLPGGHRPVASPERGDDPARGRREVATGPRSTIEPTPPWLTRPGAFALGEVAADHFPFRVWSRLVARRAGSPGPALVRYGLALGYPPFREAIAAYLRAARGVRCDAEQIMVVSGSQQAIELATRVLVDPGDAVWVEEPGYWGARKTLAAASARLVPVPVDREGLDVGQGIAREPAPRAIFVTPSHQMPLGVTMSASRRLQLLDWARQSGAWIVEDDYNSEYRYASQPVTSLQGLDRDARVIYIGTLSKVLFPSLRVGYLALPADLVPRFNDVRKTMDISAPTLLQAALTDFIADGHFARHLRRTRALYAERRRQLVAEIERRLGDTLEVRGARAGMHLTVVFRDGRADVPVALRAAERELWTPPLSTFYLDQPALRGLVLGYGGISTPELGTAVGRLADVLDAMPPLAPSAPPASAVSRPGTKRRRDAASAPARRGSRR